jgi:hypothetical protein
MDVKDRIENCKKMPDFFHDSADVPEKVFREIYILG